MRLPQVTRGEWMWVAFASAIVLLLASLPTLAGWAGSRPEREFGGFVLHVPDGFSYLAKMRLGADGAWLFSDVYAVEAHPPAPLYLPYLLLGKLAGSSSGAILAAYHLARLVFGALYLLIAYRFLALLLTAVWQRRLAWLLVAVGGGFGWLLIALTGDPVPLDTPPLDLNLGEAFSFVALMTIPHVLLARSALLAGVMWYAQALVSPNPRRYVFGAALAWLVATIGVPFDIVVAGGAVAGLLVMRWVGTRHIPWREAALGIAAGLPGAIWVSALLVMIGGNEVYAQWTAQNALPRPHLLHLLSAFGVPVALAVFGARRVYREKRPRADLFVGWALFSPLLTLIPLAVQLRLIEAFVVPLCALAVAALDGLDNRPVARAVTGVALVVLLLPSTLLLSLGGAAEALSGSERVFLSGDEAAAYAWLDAHAPPGAVVLSSEEVGLIAPSRAPVRVVLGHGFETPYYARKRAEVTGFYSDDMAASQRAGLLQKYNVRYVWWGPDERALGAVSPAGLPGLKPAFTSAQVTIYEVRGTPGE